MDKKVKEILSKDKREVLMMTTQASVNGAITGSVIGMMVAYYKGKNIYLFALMGAMCGGVLTGILVHKK